MKHASKAGKAKQSEAKRVRKQAKKQASKQATTVIT
jgi:hypothetical protein